MASGQGHVRSRSDKVDHDKYHSMRFDDRNTFWQSPMLYLLLLKVSSKKKRIWPHKTSNDPKERSILLWQSSRMAYYQKILSKLACPRPYIWNKGHLNFLHCLLHDGEVTKLTWPYVTVIKIPIHEDCRQWYPYKLLKIAYWPLKKLSTARSQMFVEVGSLDLTWLPELRWSRTDFFLGKMLKGCIKCCATSGGTVHHRFPTIWTNTRERGRNDLSTGRRLTGWQHGWF